MARAGRWSPSPQVRVAQHSSERDFYFGRGTDLALRHLPSGVAAPDADGYVVLVNEPGAAAGWPTGNSQLALVVRAGRRPAGAARAGRPFHRPCSVRWPAHGQVPARDRLGRSSAPARRTPGCLAAGVSCPTARRGGPRHWGGRGIFGTSHQRRIELDLSGCLREQRRLLARVGVLERLLPVGLRAARPWTGPQGHVQSA